MRLEELRSAWVIVALLLITILWPWSSIPWLALAAAPWLAGAAALWPERRGARTAAALGSVVSMRRVRRALMVLGAVVFLGALVFSPSAALFVFAWATAGVLLLASAGKTALAQELLTGAAVASVAVGFALGGAEALFRTRGLAWRFGTPQELAAWQQRYDKLWEHNILRFRSPHETIARRPGAKRVYATGDSYTWGDKIARTDSVWPARLERALGQAYPQFDLEVINTARRGWTTANEAELLRRLGWQFNPDLVVLQYTINDALPSGPDFRHSGEELLYPRLRLLPLRFRSGVVRSSALLSVLEGKLASLRPSRAFADTYQDDWPGWKQMQSALREVGDSSRARRTPVVFLIFPNLVPGQHTSESYPYRPVIDKVSAAATAAGLHVLDLVPIFAAQGGDWRRWWATPYDGHPNAAAHALAARALADYIAESGWLAAPPPQR